MKQVAARRNLVTPTTIFSYLAQDPLLRLPEDPRAQLRAAKVDKLSSPLLLPQAFHQRSLFRDFFRGVH